MSCAFHLAVDVKSTLTKAEPENLIYCRDAETQKNHQGCCYGFTQRGVSASLCALASLRSKKIV
jgi:hypothetical protein